MLRAFLSYPYRPEIEAHVPLITSFLKEEDIETIDGKWPDASVPLRDDIVAKIRSCDLLVSIAFKSISSSWGEHEIGVAVGEDMDVIQITDGNEPRAGMLADHFHISCSKGEGELLLALKRTIKQIKQRRYASSAPAFSANSPIEEYETEAWPAEARETLIHLRSLFATSHFELCLSEARRGAQSFPDCWRFLINQSAALTHLNKLDEADQVLDHAMLVFAKEPRAISYAYENKEWVLSRRLGAKTHKTLRSRVSFLRRAVQKQRRLEPFVTFIICLLQLDRKVEAEREFIGFFNRPVLIEAFRQKVKLQGREYIQAVAKSDLICGWLFPVEEVAA